MDTLGTIYMSQLASVLKRRIVVDTGSHEYFAS